VTGNTVTRHSSHKIKHMNHLTEGQLRAHLDSELPEAEARHLAHCAACQAQLDALAAQRRHIAHQFAMLTARETVPSPEAAWQKFQTKYLVQEKTMPQKFWFRLRPVALGLTVLAALLFAFTFAPVQQAFSAFLGLFRVQQIAVVPLDLTGLQDMGGDESFGQRISQFFADSFTVTREPGEPQTAASAAEASQLAGFTVRTLAAENPTFQVSSGGAFEFVINRASAQAVLDELGRSDLQLPTDIDGARIRVDVPAGVMSAYGDCQASDEPEVEGRPRSRTLRNCVVLTQMPSPSVDVPPGVSLAELAEIGLQITGMTAEEARSFTQSIDWASTLVLPIPRNAVVNREVQVDGVTGQLLSHSEAEDSQGYYTILWTKDGILYALSGYTNSGVGLALANSLP